MFVDGIIYQMILEYQNDRSRWFNFWQETSTALVGDKIRRSENGLIGIIWYS